MSCTFADAAAPTKSSRNGAVHRPGARLTMDWIADVTKPNCSVDGCSKDARTRGWCTKHYQRWLKYGDVLDRPGVQFESLDAYLTHWSDRSGGPDACWPWLGSLDDQGYGINGYGRVYANSPSARAHRASYELAFGAMGKDLVADHVCHDPKVCHLADKCPHRRCINPVHLKAVPASVNTSRERCYREVPTHCIRGHSLGSDGDVHILKNGKRHCRACDRIKHNAAYARKKAAA